MMSLFFRNLIFTILQPGIVAILIPFLLSGKTLESAFARPFAWYHILGLSIFAVGFVIMLICITSFAIRGKGTLSPADPTKKLVISGPYRFSRNPMYIGVTLMLIGDSIFFRSYVVGVYSLFVVIAFNIFILFFEEPRLQDEFGSEYEEYTKKVRRWF
jgi:protein-S-isoprenylcysteine O-methyltransferase Ste14